VPFVLAALMIERFMHLFQKYRGFMVWTSRVAGALLIVVGVMMLTDTMRLLTQWLQPFTPEFLRSRL
jgi:cytochrome c-type biogenesis protein